MKKFFTLLTIPLTLLSFTYLNGIEEVVAALRSGNAAQVAKFFDNTVDITLPEKSSTYSRAQAEVILRDFFSTNGVKGFEVVHKGDNGGSQYCIGKLATKGRTYRTTVYMKQKGDRQFLQEIRFENE